MTAQVQRQVAGLFVVEERGCHQLKGVPEPVTLFRLIRKRRRTPLRRASEQASSSDLACFQALVEQAINRRKQVARVSSLRLSRP